MTQKSFSVTLSNLSKSNIGTDIKEGGDKINASVYHPTDDHIPSFFITKEKAEADVGEALEKEIHKWNARTPVLIDAPTGLGKTTFIREKIVPLVLSHGTNMLLLSNRVALSLQQKKDFLKKIESPALTLLSEQGILQEKKFGCLAILTYQALIPFLNDPENREWLENVEFLVADEIHFFTSDATFNSQCDWILKRILAKFSNSIRIYLTATPWDILYPLAEAEQNLYIGLGGRYHQLSTGMYSPPRGGIHYLFKRDFSKYHLNFFKDEENLIEQIKSTDSKWIIFLDQKSKKQVFQNAFPKETIYLDADQKNTEAFKKVVQNESFEQRILLTTAVLDNGINIKSDEVKNIAVFTDDRTELLQMIGRKRLKAEETITVWVYDIAISTLKKRMTKCQELFQFEKEYYICEQKEGFIPNRFTKLIHKLWHHRDETIKNFFQISEHRLYINELAFFKIHRMAAFYEPIIEGKTTFRYEVEEWFEKDHELPVSPTANLEEFMSKHEKYCIEDDEQIELRKLIIQAHSNAGLSQARRDRNDGLKHNALNTLLQELNSPYLIENFGKFWILKATNITNTEVAK